MKARLLRSGLPDKSTDAEWLPLPRRMALRRPSVGLRHPPALQRCRNGTLRAPSRRRQATRESPPHRNTGISCAYRYMTHEERQLLEITARNLLTLEHDIRDRVVGIDAVLQALFFATGRPT